MWALGHLEGHGRCVVTGSCRRQGRLGVQCAQHHFSHGPVLPCQHERAAAQGVVTLEGLFMSRRDNANMPMDRLALAVYSSHVMKPLV